MSDEGFDDLLDDLEARCLLDEDWSNVLTSAAGHRFAIETVEGERYPVTSMAVDGQTIVLAADPEPRDEGIAYVRASPVDLDLDNCPPRPSVVASIGDRTRAVVAVRIDNATNEGTDVHARITLADD